MELKHIAFIPDGNRRFARKLGISYLEAYKIGIDKARQVMLGWKNKYEEIGVEQLTFWALSTENLNRSKPELATLFKLLREGMEKALREDLKVKVRFFGKLDLLPRDVQELVEKVEEKFDQGEYTINIGLAYGGKVELLEAFKALASSGLEFTEENLRRFLYLPDYPDLIIRTSGTIRTSGFLPWQGAYSEWYFSDKLWPEFDESEFDKAINDYFSRERRFGR